MMWHTKSWQRVLLSWLTWQFFFAELYFITAQTGIGYQINQLLWFLFGTPENLYGFRNLVLHRIVIFTLISAPPTLFGLIVYQRLGDTPVQLRLRDLFVVICIFTTPLAFLHSGSGSDSFAPLTASLFTVLLVVITGYLFWIASFGEDPGNRA